LRPFEGCDDEETHDDERRPASGRPMDPRYTSGPRNRPEAAASLGASADLVPDLLEQHDVAWPGIGTALVNPDGFTIPDGWRHPRTPANQVIDLNPAQLRPT